MIIDGSQEILIRALTSRSLEVKFLMQDNLIPSRDRKRSVERSSSSEIEAFPKISGLIIDIKNWLRENVVIF